MLRLKTILDWMNAHEYLKTHLLLKGGTAINLTIFDLPRLSVNIDMDFVPNLPREDMLQARESISGIIKAYMASEGYAFFAGIIEEKAFPEIIKQYNSGGKTAAYDYIRSNYGIRHPYFVINRIKECGKYSYNTDTDQFSETFTTTGDNVFMDLDELCSRPVISEVCATKSVTDSRPAAMEKLVRELISDRLLTLSRYITMDSSTRMILIDQTSLLLIFITGVGQF